MSLSTYSFSIPTSYYIYNINHTSKDVGFILTIFLPNWAMIFGYLFCTPVIPVWYTSPHCVKGVRERNFKERKGYGRKLGTDGAINCQLPSVTPEPQTGWACARTDIAFSNNLSLWQLPTLQG